MTVALREEEEGVSPNVIVLIRCVIRAVMGEIFRTLYVNGH